MRYDRYSVGSEFPKISTDSFW